MKRLLLTIITLVVSLAITSQAKGRFAWGAEIGTGIDMSGDDMSSLNLGAFLGYSAPWLDLIGIGAGIDNYMSNPSSTYPVFAIIRSSFAPTPRLLFGEFRIGLAVNQVTGRPTDTGIYIRPGIGFQLATGSRFRSYLMLSYLYNSITFPSPKLDTDIHGLNHAVITLGVTF